MNENTSIRKRKYLNTIINNSDKEEFKISTMSKNISNYISELVFLTKSIKDYKIYLNDKQILMLDLFLGYKNMTDVANIMNLSYSTVRSAIFGNNIKNSQGIYGTLKNVYSKITCNKNNPQNDIGNTICERTKINKEISNYNYAIDMKSRLISFTEKMDDWRDFLTDRQIEVLTLYLEHKSTTKVNKIIGKKSSWGILFGDNKLNPGGAYRKLEKEYNKRFPIENSVK